MQSVIKAGGMDDVLLGIVLGRLEKYPLADEATNLLLAAFESEESLSVQLNGQAAARPSADMAGVAAPEPAGAYLQSLTVSGFRGIGEPASLRPQPGPGLTVAVREVLRAAGVINRLAPGLARRRVQGLPRGPAVQPCSGS
jgi:hypothetical protein